MLTILMNFHLVIILRFIIGLVQLVQHFMAPQPRISALQHPVQQARSCTLPVFPVSHLQQAQKLNVAPNAGPVKRKSWTSLSPFWS